MDRQPVNGWCRKAAFILCVIGLIQPAGATLVPLKLNGQSTTDTDVYNYLINGSFAASITNLPLTAIAPIPPNTIVGNSSSSLYAAPSALTQAQIGTVLGGLTYGSSPFPTLVAPGTGYAPGDTITLAGGTSTIATLIHVGQTQGVSATVVAGGSGGTNGACTVTATTGNGTQATFSGTVSSNTLSGTLTLVTAGSYSANPTPLTAVPVTGCGLTGATIHLVMGVLSSTVANSGNYTTTPANPASQASTSGSGSGATFTIAWGTNGPNTPGTPLTLTQFGAKCDGVTDDTIAITRWALSAQPYTELAIEPGVICIFDPSNGGNPTYGMNFQNLGHFVIYGNGATIRAKAGSSTAGNSFLMHFATSTDIVIRDLTLDGNLANRTGTASFGGDNVFVEDGSARIVFENVHSINATKDDWDITADGNPTNQPTYPTDITLFNCWGNGAYRNGLSAIASVRLHVLSGQYNNANGTLPEDGIDIEPDSIETFENTYLLIDGVDTSGNTGVGIQITVSSGTTFNSHIRIMHWSAQQNAIGALSALAVNDLEVDGASISNVTANSALGVFNITTPNSGLDIVLRHLHFSQISAVSPSMVYVNDPNERVTVDGITADTIAGPIVSATTTTTVMNVDGKHINGAGGAALALTATGGSYNIFQNIAIDGSTTGVEGLYTSQPDTVLDGAIFKDLGGCCAGVVVFDTGSTNSVAKNVTVWESSSNPGVPAFKFNDQLLSIENLDAFSAGTNWTSATAYGWGVTPTATLISNTIPAAPIVDVPPGYLQCFPVAPTISSGFGTSPSVTQNNGSCSFSVNVGTGAAASSGVIGMPTAKHGWACSVADVTTPASNATQQIGSSTNTVTVTNYIRTTGVAGAWPASDILQLSCTPN